MTTLRNWRDRVLQILQEPLPTLLIVADPERLLLDEQILATLQRKGIELIEYEDPILFRYRFELTYREPLANKSVRLIIRTEQASTEELPYDLLQMGEQVEIHLSTIFPKLSLSVLKQLTSEQRDALDAVYEQFAGSPTIRDTCDFLLDKVWKEPYKQIATMDDLLKFLLRKHVENVKYPQIIENYLIDHLKRNPSFQHIALEKLFTSSSYFYAFLQQKWEKDWQDLVNKKESIRETRSDDYPYFQPVFWKDRIVQVYMSHLFQEGKLIRQPSRGIHTLPDWAQVGVIVDPYEAEKERLGYLENNLQEAVQKIASYLDWLQLAKLYGEWKEQSIKLFPSLSSSQWERITQLERQIDRAFEAWLSAKYQNLIQLPYYHQPVMVHHIPHFIELKERDKKKALVVLDGMSFVQWSQIRKVLAVDYYCEEYGVFAWVPTITSVSRQALFSGEPPYYFPDSITTTQKEEGKWRRFWENHQIPKMKVTFEKSLGQGDYRRQQILALRKPTTQVAGIVIDMIDKFTHGACQGLLGIHQEVDLWMKNGYLQLLLHDLSEQGYSIYLTSDHGNKESRGVGKISEGILAHTRGERVRIYSDAILRDRAAKQYSSIRWADVAMPKNQHVLLAKSGEAFVQQDQLIVSHGGISLEEVIVPFAHITRKKDK